MSKYVNIMICGGLGNQMFQVALVIAYAKKYNLQPIFIKTEWVNRETHWNGFMSNLSKYLVDKLPNGTKVEYRELSINYNDLPSPQQLGNPDIIRFIGYFPSERYFIDTRDDLLRLFKPTPEKISDLEIKYADILNNIDNIGILHIRRDDYQSKPDYHPLMTPDYYQRSMDIIESKINKKLKWYIIGQDYKWIQSQDIFKNCTIIKNSYDPDDLWVFHYFKYMIIANSTFSWWGAWLSTHEDKIVVVPSNWFGPKGPNPITSIYCSNWIIN